MGMSIDIINDAAEIKIRAERRAGELLKEMEKNRGTRGQLNGKNSSGGHIVKPPEEPTEKEGETLSELGVSKNESYRWQIARKDVLKIAS